MFWYGTTYPFAFVIGRMVNEPVKSTSADDGGQPHGASMSSGRATTEESRKGSLRVLDATKVHDCSVNRLSTLPKRQDEEQKTSEASAFQKFN
jgi:hypothetical protein